MMHRDLTPNSALTISGFEAHDIDVPLDDEFVISRGRMVHAEVTYVRIELEGGAAGYGEIAPFPDLTGETRADSRHAAQQIAATWIGRSVVEFRKLAVDAARAAPEQAAARCGLETALLDAFTQALGIPLWSFWGGRAIDRVLETDITLPILPAARTLALARAWHARGFRVFKMKVGLDPVSDRERIGELAATFPDVRFVLDANQAFSSEQALAFARNIQATGADVALLEQPVAQHDLRGMARVTAESGIPVVADESVANPTQALEVVRHHAAHIINLKIMKSGLLAAMEIAAIARAAELKLMIGGMMETRLSMGCSLALAYGLGDIDWLDLDTPLLMSRDPVQGGFSYAGPRMLPWSSPGLGMRPDPWCEATPGQPAL